MKNNLFTTVLSWLLATSVILSIVFSLQFIFRSRELRGIQFELNRYQTTHAMLNSMLQDIMVYSRHDAQILPLLRPFGIVPVTNQAAANPAKPLAK